MNKVIVPNLLILTIWLIACSNEDPDILSTDTIEINLGNDTTICFEDTIILKASSGYASYEWNGVSGDSIYTVIDTGTFFLKITDIAGKVGNDTIHIIPCDVYEQMHCEGDTVFQIFNHKIYFTTPCYYYYQIDVSEDDADLLISRYDGKVKFGKSEYYDSDPQQINFEDNPYIDDIKNGDTIYYKKRVIYQSEQVAGLLFTRIRNRKVGNIISGKYHYFDGQVYKKILNTSCYENSFRELIQILKTQKIEK